MVGDSTNSLIEGHSNSEEIAKQALEKIIKASKNINKDFDPLTDVRGSADYRRKAAQNLVMKYGYELTGSFVPNLADRNQVKNLVI